MCPRCCQRGGSLLHCLSTLTRAYVYRVLPRDLCIHMPGLYFCCTGLGVTSTGRYPASCPVKPGLSSSAAFRRMQPRLSVLLDAFFNYTIECSGCPAPFLKTVHLLSDRAAADSSMAGFFYTPSSTIRLSPSAAVVASSSHLSFCGCPSCPLTQWKVTL